ncbi:MBL fold metallo-hydrolase [Paenibacillus hexagrammi]|uniref:MBL fold metallo-hydrolase n=2 Tax=Paenibacillus hexagrammi TaxID=2908839 RepID=A0ABY3STA8_9BACL|nr:MBL fold metallo-hydrolase [Paenibacillus sp. YPD9-1]UJF36396.1 MBL fold metallo-hydrolase [Paenibacillus sp. YPD9-1]
MTQWRTLHQLTFLPYFFPFNCYLVEEKDGLTLIDAGLSFCHKEIGLAVRRIGKRVNRILITHAHPDHVGSLDVLKNELPDVPVYMSDREAQILRGDKSLNVDEASKPIKMAPKHVSSQPDFLLRDGDRIGSLIAYSAPGHSPGSMAFFDTRNNSLIAGDAFQLLGGIAVSGLIKPLFPFLALGTWDAKTALASAKKLLMLQPELLAVGHGRMLAQPLQAMDKAIKEAEKKFNTA